MSDSQFDLVVIGSGPAGQKGAIAAAKLRKRVAVIDRTLMIGGVCVHTGTIPSKSVREAIFQLTGFAVKALYGNNYRGTRDVTVQELAFRVNTVIARETDVIRAQLNRNGISIFQGTAEFTDLHTVEVQGDGARFRCAAKIFLSRAAHAPPMTRTFPSTASELSILISLSNSQAFRGSLLL
jgi:NAD(P) transhydrogenase